MRKTQPSSSAVATLPSPPPFNAPLINLREQKPRGARAYIYSKTRGISNLSAGACAYTRAVKAAERVALLPLYTFSLPHPAAG